MPNSLDLDQARRLVGTDPDPNLVQNLIRVVCRFFLKILFFLWIRVLNSFDPDQARRLAGPSLTQIVYLRYTELLSSAVLKHIGMFKSLEPNKTRC